MVSKTCHYCATIQLIFVERSMTCSNLLILTGCHNIKQLHLYVSVMVARLWESGWKERYYQKKFSVSSGDVDFVWQVMESYTQGLCWVMAYYYQVIVCSHSIHCMHVCTCMQCKYVLSIHV